MARMVVTDLTRLNSKGSVCTAGLSLNGHRCIRPMKTWDSSPGAPYLTVEECRAIGVKPGAIVEADFRNDCRIDLPHIEDLHYERLTVVGHLSSAEFFELLNASKARSLGEGFGVAVNGKGVPEDGPKPVCSIVTLEIQPASLSLHYDSYGKLRAAFASTDNDRRTNVSVTDLGFVNLEPKMLNNANIQIQRQARAFLRLGLTRPFSVNEGAPMYWLQVNGIYSFPDYPRQVRSY